MFVLSRFSCVWLCDPMDRSSPGSSVHWILQARTLEWVTISFSRGWTLDSTIDWFREHRVNAPPFYLRVSMCPVGGVVWRICVSLPPLGLLDFGPSPSHLPEAHLAPHSSCNSAWAPVSQSVSSVAQLCLTLCDPMDCSTPGLPVHHQLPEFTQTHVHWVTDASWVGILPRDFSRVHLRPGPVGAALQCLFLRSSGHHDIHSFLSAEEELRASLPQGATSWLVNWRLPGLWGKLSDQGQFSGPAFGPLHSKGSLYLLQGHGLKSA